MLAKTLQSPEFTPEETVQSIHNGVNSTQPQE